MVNTMSSSTATSFSQSRTLKIGIVGFGTFGQFLAKTMIQHGHTLRATSKTDHSQLCNEFGIEFFRDTSAFLEADNDVVIICTSIVSTAGVLRSMPFRCLRRPTLFVDVLSVKEYPRDILLQVLPQDSDVLCTHPMFGPESGKNGWKDLNFMYERVRIRDDDTCSSFLHIFEKEGCRMLEMSCEDHDKWAARSQFIAHTTGRMLSEMEIHSTPIDTKGFELLMNLKTNTERDSFDLFKGLYIHNRFARLELRNLELALKEVKKKLQQSEDLKADANGSSKENGIL